MSCPCSSMASLAAALSSPPHTTKSTKSASNHSSSSGSSVHMSEPTYFTIPQYSTSWCEPSSSYMDGIMLPVPRDPNAPRNDEEINKFLAENAEVGKTADPLWTGVFTKQLEVERSIEPALNRGVNRAMDRHPSNGLCLEKIKLCIAHERRPVCEYVDFFYFTCEFLPEHDVSVSTLIDIVEVFFFDELLPANYWIPANHPEENGLLVKRHSAQTVAHVQVFAKDTLFTTLPKLGRLIGLYRGTAKEIKHALYIYAFRNKLIDHEKKLINCDRFMEDVFHKKVLTNASLWHDIRAQIETSNPPLLFTYVVDANMVNQAYFEIFVPTTVVTGAFKDCAIEDYTKLQHDIEPLNETLTEVMNELKKSNEKKEFYEAIAEDPQKFFNDWPKAVFENASDNIETLTNPANYPSSFFANRDVMEPAVAQYLNNIVKQKKQELEVNLEKTTLQK